MKVINITNKIKIEECAENELYLIDVDFNTKLLSMPVGQLIQFLNIEMGKMLEGQDQELLKKKGVFFTVHVTGKRSAEDLETIVDLFSVIFKPFLIDENTKRDGDIAPLPDRDFINKVGFKLGFIYDLGHYVPLISRFSMKLLDKDNNNKQLLRVIK